MNEVPGSEPRPDAVRGLPEPERIVASEAAPVARRRLAARGMVINSGFFVGLGLLQILKTVIVAGFLTQSEFGIWSIVFLGFGLIWALKSVAVGNKFIQQDEADQKQAFEKAFTLELYSSFVAAVAMVGLAALFALIYGEPELLAPGAVLALTLPGLGLQAPAWIFYRRMQFLQQRVLTSVDPIVSFVVTIALAAAGAGYWSLVVGLLVGAWTGALAAVLASPYRPALRFDRGTLREYVSFSWPIVIGVAAGMSVAQLALLFGDMAIGLAATGAIGLAGTFATYADRIDSVITQTLYPAICRVRDRTELMMEAFVKSNRLALMWAVPFGSALALFGGDLVEFVLGDEWRDALILIQVFGITAVVNHVGFNWVAFYRAVGNTRPEAIVNILGLAAFLVVTVPLLFAYELDGLAAGTAVMAVVAFCGRWFYLARMFPNLRMIRHLWRAIVPTLPAIALVAAARAAETGERTLGMALAELALYAAATAVATLVIERRLLSEAVSYLRPQPGAAPAPG